MTRGARAIIALRYAGLLAVICGSALAISSLWTAWAVDGPHAGIAPSRSGWQWMRVGDVLLIAACLAATGLTAVACKGTRSPSITLASGIGALVSLLAAAAGATLVWWLTGWDFIVMDDTDLRLYSPGPGPGTAAHGLMIAMAGVLPVLLSRVGPLLRPARTA